MSNRDFSRQIEQRLESGNWPSTCGIHQGRSLNSLQSKIHHKNVPWLHWKVREACRGVLDDSWHHLDGPTQTIARLGNMSTAIRRTTETRPSSSCTTQKSPTSYSPGEVETYNRFSALASFSDIPCHQAGPIMTPRRSSRILDTQIAQAIVNSVIPPVTNALTKDSIVRRNEERSPDAAKKTSRRPAGINNKSQHSKRVDPDKEEDRPPFLAEVQSLPIPRIKFDLVRPSKQALVVERTLLSYLQVEAAFRPRDPKLLEYLKQRAIRHLKRYDESTLTPEERRKIIISSTAAAVVPAEEELEARMFLLNRRNVTRMTMINEFLGADNAGLLTGLWRQLSSNLVPQPLWTRFA